MATDYSRLLSGQYQPTQIVDYSKLLSGGYSALYSDLDYSSMFGGRRVDPGANERELGLIPASAYQDIPDPGHLGMLVGGVKEGLGGPLVGLGERVGLFREGSRQRMREDFEESRLGYLAADPGAARATFAGFAELLGGSAPIVPASAVARGLGGLAARTGTQIPRSLATGAVTAAEGALIGLGETAGQGPGATAMGVGLGLAAGGLAARPALKAGFLDKFDDSLIDLDKAWTKYMTSAGPIGRESAERAQQAVGSIRDTMFVARHNSEQLKLSIDDYALLNGVDATDVERMVNEAMVTRNGISALPTELQAPTQTLRTHIDELSDQILSTDHISDDLRKIILQNKGIYQHTSHRAFDDPSHIREILDTPEGQQKAALMYDFLEKETNWTPDEIRAHMDLMLEDPFNAMEIIGSRTKGVGKLDKTIYKNKKDLNPTIRDYLGLYEDPYVNYMKSVSKMANNIEWDKAYRDIFDVLTYGSDPQAVWAPRATGDYKYHIRGDRTPLSGDLGGGDSLWFRNREQAEAFSGLREATGESVLQTINAVTKLMKTVGSPQTHARNFLSGHFMMLLQGHSPFGKGAALSPVWKANKMGTKAQSVLGDITTSEGMQAYRELLRHGVVGEAVMGAEMDYWLKRSRAAFKEGGIVQRASGKAANWYRGEDDFWKVSLFLKEKKRYRKAFPALPEEEINGIAAGIVNDTMQVYSKVPFAIQKVRSNIFLGPFVSFPSEIVRNVKNTVKQTFKELNHLNPRVRRIGWQRLSGLVSTIAVVPTALAITGRHLSGVSRDQEDALRSFMPPWSENSNVMMIPGGDRENGEYHFIDVSFMDPYNYLKKPVVAMARNALRGDIDGAEKAWNVATEALDPIMSPEIFWTEMLALHGDLTKSKKTPPSTKARKIAYRLYRAFAPGAVLSGERILRGADVEGVREVLPSTSKYGKKYNFTDEVWALGGPRISTISVPQAFQFKAREYMSARRQASGVYNTEARNKGQRSAHMLLNARREAEVTNSRAGQQLLRFVQDARTSGMTDAQIIRELMNGGVSNRDARVIVSGRIPAMRFR